MLLLLKITCRLIFIWCSVKWDNTAWSVLKPAICQLALYLKKNKKNDYTVKSFPPPQIWSLQKLFYLSRTSTPPCSRLFFSYSCLITPCRNVRCSRALNAHKFFFNQTSTRLEDAALSGCGLHSSQMSDSLGNSWLSPNLWPCLLVEDKRKQVESKY